MRKRHQTYRQGHRNSRLHYIESLESRICLSAVVSVPINAVSLPAQDDPSSSAVDLPFSVNFFGNTYSQLYVNNNGNVTFTNFLGSFTPDDLTTPGHIPEIAAFYADVDSSGTGSGVTTYGPTTAPFDFGSGAHNAFVVNWPNVGYYTAHTDKLNNFQLILIDRSDTGAGNFDIEMNYDQVQWEAGDLSGGTNGLGGGTNAAAVGYTDGSGNPGTFFTLPGSRSAGSLIDGGPNALISNSLNSSVPGRYIFQVRNGTVNGTTTLPSNVDTSFGSNGTVNIPWAVEQVVQAPSGQILAVGHQGASGAMQGLLEQLNSDGSVDANFAGGGTASSTASSNDAFYTAAVQPNGQILAGGSSNGTFYVARYNADGSLDTNFGNAGYATASFGSGAAETMSSLAVEPDGSIVAAGVENNTFAIARFSSAGALDSTFNPGGAADGTFPTGGQRTIVAGAAGGISQVIIQPNGKIVGVGSAGTNVAVFRLNEDGTNDDSFGTNGATILTQLGSQAAASVPEGVAFQPGGGILVSGEAPGGNGIAVARVASTGQLDTSFGSSGVATASFGASDVSNAIVVDPTNGQFLLLGTTNAGGTNQAAVAAFNPDGSVNTTFGTNGQITLPAPTSGATGSTHTSSVRPFAFHPLLSDFAFGSFQSDGHVLIGASNSNVSALRRVQPFTPSTSAIGDFGKINRKNVKLAPFTLANGTTVTITLQGGSGAASHQGNEVNLTLTGSVAVAIRTKGGANAMSLNTVTVNGALRTLSAPTSTLSGKLTTTDAIGQLTLANITGVIVSGRGIAKLTAGNLAGSIECLGVLGQAKIGNVSGTIAAATIRSVVANNFAGATILAGANLGLDGQLGGAGDSFASGQIFSLRVSGSMVSSFVGAGVNPVDGIFGDGDDKSAGPPSFIKNILIKGAMSADSKFESASLPKVVRLPQKTITATDGRFVFLQ